MGSHTILHSATTNIPGTRFWCINDWAFKQTHTHTHTHTHIHTNLRFRWVMRTVAQKVTHLRRCTSKMLAPKLWIQNQTHTDIQPLSPRPFSKVKGKVPPVRVYNSQIHNRPSSTFRLFQTWRTAISGSWPPVWMLLNNKAFLFLR